MSASKMLILGNLVHMPSYQGMKYNLVAGIHTLKTGILIENGDSFLTLLQGLSNSAIEVTLQVRSKLPTFSLRRLSTSLFIS